VTPPSAVLAILVVIAVFMAVEARVASANERALLARGAVEPKDDVYRVMRAAYPGTFLLMGAEGLLRAGGAGRWVLAGAAILAVAKALKYWAVATLGARWTFRVLVLPGEALIQAGPYRYLRHPNYVAVVGELVGAALMFQAPVAGLVATAGFTALMSRRIAVEERALGLR
jgi:methyltransferase